MKLISLAIVASLVGLPVFAGCPDTPPTIKWNMHSDDQILDQVALKKQLTSRKVKYSDGGTEQYRKNGNYRYSADGQQYTAPSYKFYPSGVRCIAYSKLRYDRYVVNNGKLVLINTHGGRYEATVK